MDNSQIWRESAIDLGIIGIGGIWIALWEDTVKYIPSLTIKTAFCIIAVVSIFIGSFCLRKITYKAKEIASHLKTH